MAIDFAPSATPSPRYTSNTPTLATSERSALSAALRMSPALTVSPTARYYSPQNAHRVHGRVHMEFQVR